MIYTSVLHFIFAHKSGSLVGNLGNSHFGDKVVDRKSSHSCTNVETRMLEAQGCPGLVAKEG
jgi:hypothetical protein